MFNLFFHPDLLNHGHFNLKPRIPAILEVAKEFDFINIAETKDYDEDLIKLAHSDEFINKMRNFTGLDGFPIWRGTTKSLFSCISSVNDLAENQGQKISFALTSDGGHHASRDSQWDMCYLNHIAISAFYFQQKVPGAKILIIDTDFHHGDGTLDIVKNKKDIDFFCIHCSEDHSCEENEFENCFDIMIKKEIRFKDYMARLDDGLKYFSKEYDLILYDFGFDLHWLDYGGLNNFREDETALVALKVIDFALQHSKYGISFQLAGGASPINAREVFRRVFAGCKSFDKPFSKL